MHDNVMDHHRLLKNILNEITHPTKPMMIHFFPFQHLNSIYIMFSTTRTKTASEEYVESSSCTVLKVPPTRRSASTQSDVTITGDGPLPLNINEVNSLLHGKQSGADVSKSNKDDEKKERKIKAKDADERICSCLPPFMEFMECKTHRKGILRGIKQSIPNKLHIIQYWRKQINDKVHRKKQAIVVDNNPDMNISYQELDEFSNSIAYHLKQQKFSDKYENRNPNGECIIAVVHPPCYEYIAILLAILKLGAAFLPISYDLPPERIADIIKLTRPILTIITSEEDELSRQVRSIVEFEVMHVDEIWGLLEKSALDKSLLPFKDPIQSPDPNMPYPAFWKRTVAVSVIPSDTHELQAVAYDSKAFLNRIMWENHFFVYFSSEYVLVPPNLETVDNIADILTPLCNGVTLVILQSTIDYLIPDQLFFYCKCYKLRRLTLWPSLLKACCTSMQLFEDLSQQVSTVRYWFCVGGFLRTELADMFFEFAPALAQLVHMYHYEDCVGALCFQIYECGGSQLQNYYSRLPVGFPAPNVEIYILGPDLKPVPDGSTGEIFVSGLQLPKISKENVNRIDNDYYRDNPFSKKKDNQVMMRTMDIGRITMKKNGARVLIHEMTRTKHYYVDNQIVWLHHIDMYLQRLTHLVKTSHTLCYRANESEQIILAFCVLSNTNISVLTIEDELKNSLPLAMIPECLAIETIPTFEDSNIPDDNILLKLYQDMRNSRKKPDSKQQHIFSFSNYNHFVAKMSKKLPGQIFLNWDVLNISNPQILRAAKVLSHVLFTFLGIPIKHTVEVCWNQPFLQLRRATVTKGVFIVKELHKNRYPIDNEDLMLAESLQEIVEKMVDARRDRGFCSNNCPADEVLFVKTRYKLDVMVNSNRVSVCGLLARCFTQRDQLDYFAEVSYKSMRKFFDDMWPIFVSKKLSIVIRKKKENRLVGAVLSMSWHDEMELTRSTIPLDIFYKLQLIHYLEAGLTNTHFIQDKTHVCQICFVGLDSTALNPYEIHGLMDKIIRCMLIFAKVRGFEALVLIAYDFFSVDICVNSYNFHVAKECQVNQFVACDGLIPYAMCPDSMVAKLCWKRLDTVRGVDEHHAHIKPKTIAISHDHKKPWTVE